MPDNCKKKLGHNLNQFVKAPPIRPSADGKSSKNGLLLLSTKAPKKGGMLSNKSETPKTTEETVIAAPDAWGTVEKSSHSPPPLPEVHAVPPTHSPPKEESRQNTQTEPTSPRSRGDSSTDGNNVRVVESWDAPRRRTESRGLWEGNSRSQKEPERRGRGRGDEIAKASVKAPSSPTRNKTEATNKEPETPMIHLNGYDDRSRGEAPTAAPRMLYDPKSGSMVAVQQSQPQRKSKTTARRGGARSRKTPNKKNATPAAPNSPKQAPTPDKRRGRLPRTCGVLYERVGKKIRCADGCDGGDLGYGAHSVPGGRVRNPVAYREYCRMRDEMVKAYRTNDATTGYGSNHQVLPSLKGGNIKVLGDKKDQSLLVVSKDEPLEWVTADDKLDLLVDDTSPTLKPTAKVFAPSQAALAAAAAAAAEKTDDEEDDDGTVDLDLVGVDGEDDNDGLGFDPTRDMTGLVQEDASKTNTSSLVEPLAVDLNALRLDPLPATSNSGLFSFGGTWGKETTSETGDWNATGLGNGGLFGSDTFASPTTTSTGPSLLNGTSTWSGLGGLALDGDAKTGD